LSADSFALFCGCKIFETIVVEHEDGMGTQLKQLKINKPATGDGTTE
jgi:hypothetical protein